MPLDTTGQKKPEKAKFTDRRHKEWEENRLDWIWIQDSLEGGRRYREQVYGWDNMRMPVMNLIRHKHEFDDLRTVQRSDQLLNGGTFSPPGTDAGQKATNNSFELRRARTPVPTSLREAIETHLSQIYSREVRREGPPELVAFWEDVDGQGTNIDDWMKDTVAPLLLALGQLDFLVDHPAAPDGVEITTEADKRAFRLDLAAAQYLLPENVVWWRLGNDGKYAEVLVKEWAEDENGQPVERYRHWTATQSQLYDENGEKVGAAVSHAYKRVPIERVFDRKNPRLRNVGLSRYYGICEKQREIYNKTSELVLSDTHQSFPLLQGPEEYCKADGSMPIGPNYLLPMKASGSGADRTYQGFSVVNFPKDGAESIRQNTADLLDAIDRDAKLVKPAGTGTNGSTTVAQSGVSKTIDQDAGAKLLASIAKTLRRCEERIARLALTVLGDGPPSDAEIKAIEIVYPTTFNLQSMDDLAKGATAFQAFVETAGDLPITETKVAQAWARLLVAGQDDDAYADIDEEIETAIEAKAQDRAMRREAMPIPPRPPMKPADGAGDGMGDGSGGPDLAGDSGDQDPQGGESDPINLIGMV